MDSSEYDEIVSFYRDYKNNIYPRGFNLTHPTTDRELLYGWVIYTTKIMSAYVCSDMSFETIDAKVYKIVDKIISNG